MIVVQVWNFCDYGVIASPRPLMVICASYFDARLLCDVLSLLLYVFMM